MSSEGAQGPHAAYSFDKLDGVASYHNWKFQMKMALIMEGLWSCIERTEGEAITPAKDQRALARICLSVKSNCIQYLRSVTTAKQAWEKLKEVFEDKGLYRRVLLLRKLHRSNYNDYSSMGEYIDGVMTLVQQLADIGRVIEDKEVAELLLSGLPQEFDVLVSSLETANILENLTSEAVRARLLQEEFRKQSDNGVSIPSESSFIVCHYCKKPGHVKSKCFKLKRDNRNKSNKKSVQVSAQSETFLVCALAECVNSANWIIDSGCTSHMCNNKNLFTSMDTSFTSNVTVADNNILQCKGKGYVTVYVNKCSRIIENVLYVPNLSANLLSVSKLTDKGYSVIFNNDKCHIKNKNRVLASASHIDGLYKLDCSVPNSSCLQSSFLSSCTLPRNVQEQESALAAGSVPVDVWHKRLGHLSLRGMCALRDNLAEGVNFHSDQLGDCISCIKGKQTVKTFPKGSTRRSQRLLELVHSDVCGPMSEPSWGGARYLVTFTDDYSRKTYGYLMKNKDEVMSCFIKFKVLVERQTECMIKCLRSDNGGEYCNAKFINYLSSHGIVHQTTIPYSPQQNGVAERLNRTLVEKARTMLSDSGLGPRFWGEALMTAIYLKNRSPTAALPGSTPEEVWTGSKVNLSHLRVFGCRVFSLIPESKRSGKFNEKSKEFIFVGYCDDSKGYRLMDPCNPKRIIKSRNVYFIELTSNNNPNLKYNNNNFINLDMTNNSSGNNNNDIVEINQIFPQISGTPVQEPSVGIGATSQSDFPAEERNESPSVEVNQSPAVERGQSPDEFEGSLEDRCSSSCSDTEDTESIPKMADTGRPVRTTRGIRPKRYDDYLSDCSLLSHTPCFDEPQSYNDAMVSTNKAEWECAMKEEYNSLIKNGAWTLVDRPFNRNVIKSKWVFKVKQDASGNFDKFKARLVARGFSQKPGVDFDKTFSPVVRHSTLRILFNLANEKDMDIDHIDVTTAFLNGSLQEEIYMEQPPGFEIDNNKVCMLQKSIYGLKQASRVWNETVHKLLTTHGYSQTRCEPCVYVKRNNTKSTILALYVDDFYIFSNCNSEKEALISFLKSNFEIKNLGSIKDCLGISVHRDRDRGTIILKQSAYIRRLLVRFGMLECKGVSTPMSVNDKFEKPLENDECKFNYRELIGGLMYLSVCTRPDISFSVSMLSQFNNNYNLSHWLAAKRILRYLKNTLNYGLIFTKCKNDNLEVFADADWANDPVDRKSYSGFLIKFGNNTVNWESRKQRCIALSSTEAEYLAISDACKDVLFIKNFWYEITGCKIKCKVLLQPLLQGNKALISIVSMRLA
ncbi:unnamed protein product [Euphydryas editha]|uniref:Integrase catalytic domain-containing protein n=1 Tax=Euphydryas editha TaxID=104508 RepID=A0AAU9U2L7_EUPED|nr:unnamed protein product [Euphydryas editha]